MSQKPVFDSRVDGLQYWVTTFADDKPIGVCESIDDPFVSQTVTTHFAWRDRLAILFGKEWVVRVNVGGTRKITEAVLELDDNYRGEPGSERRAECDAQLHQALKDFGS